MQVVNDDISFFAVAQRTRALGLKIWNIVELIIQRKLDMGKSLVFRKRILVLRVQA
jgi:hypothetical protein